VEKNRVVATRFLAVSTEYRRVTDGQPNKQTDKHMATAQSALCIASRGKNDSQLMLGKANLINVSSYN